MYKFKVIKRSKETKPLLGIQHIQVQTGVHLHVTLGDVRKSEPAGPAIEKSPAQGRHNLCLFVRMLAG